MAFQITAECISCGICKSVCVPGAIVEEIVRYRIVESLCGECKECVDVCPVDCIVGNVEEAEVRKSKADR